MAPALRAVTFDAYGTLFDGGTSELVALCRRLIAKHGLDATLEDVLAHREALVQELQARPFVAMRERDRWILGRLFQRYGVEGERKEPLVEQLYAAHVEKAHPYPDARGAVDAVRDMGLDVAVVSNADRAMMRQLLERTGFASDFDVVVTSEAARCYKPGAAIFERACHALGHPPPAVLHVGDSYAADVAGAKAAGLRACWLNRGDGLPAVGGGGSADGDADGDADSGGDGDADAGAGDGTGADMEVASLAELPDAIRSIL